MAGATASQGATVAHKPFYKVLYVQVLVAIVLGFLVGWLAPDIAESPWMKALGDGFIKLIKMAIAPIIFCTVVSGIAHIEDASKVGRVGVKALIYFEIVSTLALAIGLLVGNFVRPGDGFSGAAGDAGGGRRVRRRAPRTSRPSSSSCTSSPTAWSAPLPTATSCRCCSSPSCSVSR